MTGKCYYRTTLDAWRRQAHRFANSHWLALNDGAPPDDATTVLVLIEADEGTHLALEGDSAFEALPHPLAQRPVSDATRAALAASPVGTVAPGATTFDAAEAAARVHPLLRHRVF